MASAEETVFSHMHDYQIFSFFRRLPAGLCSLPDVGPSARAPGEANGLASPRSALYDERVFRGWPAAKGVEKQRERLLNGGRFCWRGSLTSLLRRGGRCG